MVRRNRQRRPELLLRLGKLAQTEQRLAEVQAQRDVVGRQPHRLAQRTKGALVE